MDAARDYAVAGPVGRHLNALALRNHSFFFMFVAIPFLIEVFGQSTADNCKLFTASVTLILGLWMVMLSFFLRMFPVAAARIVPPVMEAVRLFVFGLRIDVFFSYFS